MLIDNKRALAYTVTVDSITPIMGADNIELAHVGGWSVIIKKNEFKSGDMGVFFEIDSKLPEAEWSEFLRKKHFKVKTYKINKFNATSQGLLLPISILPSKKEWALYTDVTDLLRVTYSVAEDNARKSKSSNPNEKYNRMAQRHTKLAKKKWFRWFMKRKWGKRLLFVLFGRKVDKPKEFPNWITCTDEERIENRIWELKNKEPLICTEKIDGTSSTYFLDLTKKKPDFGVCSRNIRQPDLDKQNSQIKDNVYWKMAFQYNISVALRNIARQYGVKRIVLQGEIYGVSIQGNPYKLSDTRFAAFNLIFDGIRLNSMVAKEVLAGYNIPFVPIIEENYIIPDDFEELKLQADGYSTINPKCRREGFVYRGKDGKRSFKNVSREYLLYKKE